MQRANFNALTIPAYKNQIAPVTVGQRSRSNKSKV